VCDQPHPLVVAKVIQACSKGQLDEAYMNMKVWGWVKHTKGHIGHKLWASTQAAAVADLAQHMW
jgi:hypothetical protein